MTRLYNKCIGLTLDKPAKRHCYNPFSDTGAHLPGLQTQLENTGNLSFPVPLPSNRMWKSVGHNRKVSQISKQKLAMRKIMRKTTLRLEEWQIKKIIPWKNCHSFVPMFLHITTKITPHTTIPPRSDKLFLCMKREYALAEFQVDHCTSIRPTCY